MATALEKQVIVDALGGDKTASFQAEHGNSNVHTETLKGSAALAAAIRASPPKPLSKPLIHLYAICIVAFLCSSLNGFDGSLMGALLPLPQFQNTFGVGLVGSKAGLISGMYTIGGVCALPFIGPCCDILGRRAGMFAGCSFVILGTIVCGTSSHLGQFLAGRFFLGVGYSIAAAAAPAYVVEISHPAYRSVLTGLYNSQYYVGSITAGGACRGIVNYPGPTAWRIPIWCQMICSGVVVIFVWLLPESPRWLYSHGHKEKAWAIITKFHGDGNADNAFVKLQIREYEEEISLVGSDKRWWDYRECFNSHASRWRIGCMLIPSVFGQWAGNGVISYYIGGLLATAGVHNPTTVENINLGNSILSAFGAYLGASFVGKLGRRNMLVGVNIACSIIFAGITAGTGVYSANGSSVAANASVAFIFLFGFFYSIGWTPLQALYPVECLSYEIRAKGMALSSAGVNAAVLLNQFAWPVALQKIGWKTYIIFVVWDLIQAFVCWLFAVETNNRTLEELNEIFAAPNPRKASTEKRTVIVANDTREILDVKAEIVA